MLEKVTIADKLTLLGGNYLPHEKAIIFGERDLAINELIADFNESALTFHTEGEHADLAGIFAERFTPGYDKSKKSLFKKVNDLGMFVVFNAAAIPASIASQFSIEMKKVGIVPTLSICNEAHTIDIPLVPDKFSIDPKDFGHYVGQYWYKLQTSIARKNKPKEFFERAELVRNVGHQLGADMMVWHAKNHGVYLSQSLVKRLFFITAYLYPRKDNPFPEIALARI